MYGITNHLKQEEQISLDEKPEKLIIILKSEKKQPVYYEDAIDYTIFDKNFDYLAVEKLQ